MIEPLEVAAISIAGSLTLTTLLFAYSLYYTGRRFNQRVIWTDDATWWGKIRTVARHELETTDWMAVAINLPKIAAGAAVAIAALLIFAVGFVEVFL